MLAEINWEASPGPALSTGYPMLELATLLLLADMISMEKSMPAIKATLSMATNASGQSPIAMPTTNTDHANSAIRVSI